MKRENLRIRLSIVTVVVSLISVLLSAGTFVITLWNRTAVLEQPVKIVSAIEGLLGQEIPAYSGSKESDAAKTYPETCETCTHAQD